MRKGCYIFLGVFCIKCIFYYDQCCSRGITLCTILTFCITFLRIYTRAEFCCYCGQHFDFIIRKYRILDSLSKLIMIALTITTVAAVLIALLRNGWQELHQ